VTFWGTITQVPGSHPSPGNPAWIYADYWCLSDPSNCSNTIEN